MRVGGPADVVGGRGDQGLQVEREQPAAVGRGRSRGTSGERGGPEGECQGLEAMELASQADAEASRRSLGGDGDIPGADGV